jgi:glycosyltransferase involved in cell wall biosynthesis
MRKRKIVLVSNIAWTISNFRLDLIKKLISEKYRVTCISSIDNFDHNSSKEIINTGAKYLDLKISRKGLNPILDGAYFFGLLKKMKNEKPSVLILYTIKSVIYGSIVGRILNIPTISVITGLGYVFNKKSVLALLIKYLYRFSIAKNKKVYFLNSIDRDEFLNLKITQPSKSIILNSEGVNTKDFKPQKKLNSNKIIFLQMCRFLWEKGIGEYIEAARILKSKYDNLEFQLLGFFDKGNPGAIDEKTVKNWVVEGIINFLGSSNNVKEYLNQCNCLVLASYYREGVPRSLLEAASMEIPIITTDSVGCKETVNDNITGYLCKPRSVEDLVYKMEQIILKSPEELQIMGEKARIKMINEFDVNHINQIYLNEINSINFEE